MATVVIMPKQGQSVESCILTQFGKEKSEQISKGDLLFAYETDKASFEEFSPVDGIILEFFYEVGDEVPVLKEVCVIGAAGEVYESHQTSSVKSGKSEPEVKVPSLQSENVVAADVIQNKSQATTSFAISPRAKLLAEKEGINFSNIVGSGPAGRIIERDILAISNSMPRTTPLAKMLAGESAILSLKSGQGIGGSITADDMIRSALSNSSPEEFVPEEFIIEKLTNIRKLIAKAMYQSLQNSAQLTHHLSADARQLQNLRKQVKKAVDQGYPVNITLNDMICYAAIKALTKFPRVNSHFNGDSMKLFSKVHLGMAVDTDRGLMVPALKNASDLSIRDLSIKMREIAESCRKGNVDPDILSSEAASFTVSNLGNYGVEMFTPVLNLPQSAILGVNTIIPRPKDIGDGVFAFVPHLGLSLTYNHQSLDGGEATRFLKQIAIEIENLTFEL